MQAIQTETVLPASIGEPSQEDQATRAALRELIMDEIDRYFAGKVDAEMLLCFIKVCHPDYGKEVQP